MSKRATIQMIFVVLTAVAATLALLIGWTEPGHSSTLDNQANSEAVHGKAIQ